MNSKPTIAAAIIEANRAKNPVRHVIDYDHRAACMDVLIEAARYREPRKPTPELEFCYGNGCCPNCCAYFIDKSTHYCGNCGQALDWSGE